MPRITINILENGIEANVDGLYPSRAVNQAIKDFKEQIRRALRDNQRSIVK